MLTEKQGCGYTVSKEWRPLSLMQQNEYTSYCCIVYMTCTIDDAPDSALV